MKPVVSYVIILCSTLTIRANEAEFLRAYDSKRYDDAAKYIDGLDITKPDVARRLGVMLYKGQGVKVDQDRGKALLKSAMLAGDAIAGVNLTKLYFKLENDLPNAACCLLLSEMSSSSAMEDVQELRARLGAQYKEGLALYVKQSHDNEKQLHDNVKRLEDTIETMQKTSERVKSECLSLKDKLLTAENRQRELESLFEQERDGYRKLIESRNADIKAMGQKISDLEANYKKAELKIRDLENKISDSDLGMKDNKTDHDSGGNDNGSTKDDSLVNDLQDDREDILVWLEQNNNASRKEKRHYSFWSQIDKDRSASGGLHRGWRTFWSAPGNFARVVPATEKVYDSCEAHGINGVVGAVISAPVILCSEVVPTACDLFNGLLDMISLGYYGDWLYSGSLTSEFWGRDDSHFPWLDRR